jgi:hypothetical protein
LVVFDDGTSASGPSVEAIVEALYGQRAQIEWAIPDDEILAHDKIARLAQVVFRRGNVWLLAAVITKVVIDGNRVTVEQAERFRAVAEETKPVPARAYFKVVPQ